MLYKSTAIKRSFLKYLRKCSISQRKMSESDTVRIKVKSEWRSDLNSSLNRVNFVNAEV